MCPLTRQGSPRISEAFTNCHFIPAVSQSDLIWLTTFVGDTWKLIRTFLLIQIEELKVRDQQPKKTSLVKNKRSKFFLQSNNKMKLWKLLTLKIFIVKELLLFYLGGALKLRIACSHSTLLLPYRAVSSLDPSLKAHALKQTVLPVKPQAQIMPEFTSSLFGLTSLKSRRSCCFYWELWSVC